MSSMYCVAWGMSCGRRSPNASIDSHQRASNSAATSASVRPSSAARLMMLSSTSVTLATWCTFSPEKLR